MQSEPLSFGMRRGADSAGGRHAGAGDSARLGAGLRGTFGEFREVAALIKDGRILPARRQVLC
jgi:hypothetical protein